ncbi:Uncharacterized conserved protein, DUF58 family, contains vWF domain [Agrococcus baldri]|uniref:Uncharacterized conserved protein, DUF58 family, contains vWF domain n=1 Tax=Agrococcus baldri TaxID=153730 RepID=A0AA94KYE6_9MICO|nr:DUF58 domain-containing protein [Agrococcus baldri]SFR98041.1 Uncharacterized conserved protein, DUF58 family, contains vWF domain [Agrococcus baldri]
MRALDAVTRTLSPWGWSLVAVVVLGLVLARTLGWTEALVAAVAAAVLLLGAIPWIVGERWARARIGLSAERVPVGADALALVEVSRPTRAATPNQVDLVVGEDEVVLEIPPIEVGGRVVRSVPLDTSRRGLRTIGPATIIRTDPFGVLERRHRLTDSRTLVVHPRVVRLPGGAGGIVRDLDGEAAAERTADDVSFHSLREYAPGDDRRLVHWRSSARLGTLLVRQFEPSRRADTLIVLSTDPREYDGDDFELALSLVGTLGLAAMADRRALRIVESPRGERGEAHAIDAATRDRLLDALAVLQPQQPLGIAAAARASRRAAPGSLAWLITGSTVPPRTLRTAANGMPAGVVSVVVRAAVGALPSRSRLGDADVVTVGAIEDLSRGIGQSRQR